MPPLTQLSVQDSQTGEWNVIIETPKGSRNKFKYDEELGLFKLRKVLPLGSTFPFDFGFLPSTRASDGDPLDVLLLMDEPVFPGCLVEARLLGVLEAEQTEQGQTSRNDRLIAVAVHSPTHQGMRSLEDLGQNVLDQIEHFFVSYNVMENRQFKPIGRHGPGRAEALIEEGKKRFGQS